MELFIVFQCFPYQKLAVSPAPSNPKKKIQTKIKFGSVYCIVTSNKNCYQEQNHLFAPLKLNSNNQHKEYFFRPNFGCQGCRTATGEIRRQMEISLNQFPPPALAPQRSTPPADTLKQDLSAGGIHSQARLEDHQTASCSHAGKKSSRKGAVFV